VAFFIYPARGGNKSLNYVPKSINISPGGILRSMEEKTMPARKARKRKKKSGFDWKDAALAVLFVWALTATAMLVFKPAGEAAVDKSNISEALARANREWNNGDKARAAQIWGKVLAVDAENFDANRYLASFLLEKNDAEEAVRAAQLYKTALRRKADPRTEVSVAHAWIKANKYREAEKVLRECARKTPGFSQLWEEWAFLHGEKKEYTEGIQCAEKAMKLDPQCSYCPQAIEYFKKEMAGAKEK
jgi:tetratricopeptide (TPR) repeat protein